MNMEFKQPEKGSSSEQITALKAECLRLIDENRVYLSKVESWENEVNNSQSLGAFQKVKRRLLEELETVDKLKAEKIEGLRQDLFQLIAEQNAQVGPEILKQIASCNTVAGIKHLIHQVKEIAKLGEAELDRINSSIRALEGGLYGQGKNRKH